MAMRNASKESFRPRPLQTMKTLLDPKDSYKSPARQLTLTASESAPSLRGLARRNGRRDTVNEATLHSAGSMAARSHSKSGAPTPKEAASEEKAMTFLSIKKKEKTDSIDCVACQLALKHRLNLSEVKAILKELRQAERNDQGAIEEPEFDKVMARIFDVPVVKKSVCKDAYKVSGAATKISIDLFLNWYVQNMFTEVNAMTADQAMAKGEVLAYEMARKYGVSRILIDKIKKKFDQYDSDHSGYIDYEEFQSTMLAILKCEAWELNLERIHRFWKEIDSDGSGGIDFSEFLQWYFKYFSPGNEDDFDLCGSLTGFYHSFDPINVRHQMRNHG